MEMQVSGLQQHSTAAASQAWWCSGGHIMLSCTSHTQRCQSNADPLPHVPHLAVNTSDAHLLGPPSSHPTLAGATQLPQQAA